MKDNENTLRPSLTSHAMMLDFTASEAEKLLLPTVKRILRYLRDYSVGSAGDSGGSVGAGGDDGGGGGVMQ